MFTINEEKKTYREEAAFIPKVISVNFTEELQSDFSLGKVRIGERPLLIRLRFDLGLARVSIEIFKIFFLIFLAIL